MDDEEGKARRNLVICSSLVLAAWWLKVPPEATMDRLVGMKAELVDPLRVWTAAFLVLAYLGLRYRFSVEARRSFKALRREHRAIFVALVRWQLERAAVRFTAKDVDSPLFHNELRSFAKRATQSEVAAQN